MGALKTELDEHFTSNVLKTASYFQPVNGIEQEGQCMRISFDIEGFNKGFATGQGKFLFCIMNYSLCM